MKKQRSIELVHKYLVKLEYIEKVYSPQEQEKYFKEYLGEINGNDDPKYRLDILKRKR